MKLTGAGPVIGDGAPATPAQPSTGGPEPKRGEATARQTSNHEAAKRQRIARVEIVVILLAAAIIWVLENRFNFMDSFLAWDVIQTLPGADETVAAIIFLSFALGVFSYRRLREVQAEVQERQKVEGTLRLLQIEMESRVQARTAELSQANTALQAEADERIRAQESLRQADDFNSRLVDACPAGIIYLDHNHRVSFENPAVRRMMGVAEDTRSQVMGQKLFELPQIRALLGDSALQAFEAGQSLRGVVMHFHTLSGLDTDVELTSAPLEAEPGQQGGMLLLALDITERKRAESELARRLAELEAVSRISTALRGAQTLEDMLPLLVDETVSIIGGIQGSIWLYDAARDEVEVAFERGWDASRPGPFKGGQGIPGHVISSGQPYIARELRTDPLMPDAVRGQIPAGLGGVCVPIRAAEEIIGALYVNTMLPREFTEADAHLLTTLAEIAGNAIRRTTLHQQTERRLRHLLALSDIDRAISSSFVLSLSLTTLLDQLVDQLTVDAADVLLFNASSQMLEGDAARGFRSGAFEKSQLRLGEGHAGRAALERRTVHISDLAAVTDNPRLAEALPGEGFVGYFGVPLIAKGKIQGVLEVFQRARLEPDQEWLDFLNTLAGQAAIAIDNALLFDNLQRSNTELALAYDATIEGWSHALDLRDKETEGHTRRVTAMTIQMAQHFDLGQDDMTQVRWGALLHDIGKMGIPDGILLKPGPLTAEEWVVMRKHPTFAYEMLSPIRYLRSALDIPYCHHEKWDGTGYPRGLTGEQIPLTARIFAVVDVWDALTSDRPYRAAWPADQVREHIRSLAGTHFDPRVVKIALDSGILVGHERE